MTESTQQPDLSKSAQEVDTFAAIRKALEAGPTPGPWHVDTEKNEGEYGDGGPDSRCGFNSFSLFDDRGRTLCDTLNSDATEVHEDFDEDGGSAWDEVGRRNMEFIAACDPTTIAALLAAADRAKDLEADARRYRKWRADYTNPETNEVGHLSRMLLDLADAWTPEQVDAAIDHAQGEQA